MPRTRLSSGSSPSEVRRRQRATPQIRELQKGCILWLPKKAEIDDDLLEGVEIVDACFDHPVVVLSTNLVQGKATVFIVSTPVQSLRSHLVQLS